MTARTTPIRQFVIAGVAVLTTAMTFGATLAPVSAQAQSSVYYRATLEQPVERTTEVVRGATFICSGTICVGTKSRSRPALVCERLAREVGPVAAFSADGTDLDSDDLATCRSEDA